MLTINIANVQEPKAVSLTSTPNFLVFESLESSGTIVDVSLKVLDTTLTEDYTEFVILETESETYHSFRGTRDRQAVNSNTFFIDESTANTAQNIRGCLRQNAFFKSKFTISIPPVNTGGVYSNGDTLVIRSLSTGVQYSFSFDALNPLFLEITGDPTSTENNDTISMGADTEIEVDIYRTIDCIGSDTGVFGQYLTSLSKSYNNATLWFDVNSYTKNTQTYSNAFLFEEWSNTGTLNGYRLIGHRFDGVTREAFYVSNCIYTLTGYARALDDTDLSIYVYDTANPNIVKPLTTQPTLTHVPGQKQYFNFILSFAQRYENVSFEIGILYRLYSQSRVYLGDYHSHEIDVNALDQVNTVALDLDAAIDDLNVGIVEVYLTRNQTPISEPLKFEVKPACLHPVKDFAFLNSLGGWSSFNFEGRTATDFKTEPTTINKTQTPGFSVSSELESVASKDVEEVFTVKTSPLRGEVIEWLKELASSVAVYEIKTKRYIIVEEFNIFKNSKDDLFEFEMRYRYSDKFNGT